MSIELFKTGLLKSAAPSSYDGDLDASAISALDKFKNIYSKFSSKTTPPSVDSIINTFIYKDTQEYQENQAALGSELGDLFRENNILNSFDKNNDGAIDRQEFLEFLNLLNEYEDEFGDISLDDLVSKESEDEESEPVLKNTNTEGALDFPTKTITNPISSPKARTKSSNVQMPKSKNTKTKTKSKTPKRKSANQMSKEELTQTLTTTKEELNQKKQNLSLIISGSDPEVQSLKDYSDKIYSVYLEELNTVDSVMAQELNTLVSDIDTQKAQIRTKEQDIANQQCTIRENESSYNCAKATREALEGRLSALRSMVSSDMDDDKKAELMGVISSLTVAVRNAQARENLALSALEESRAQLTELEGEKDTLDKALEVLDNKKTLLENDIKEKHSELDEYIQAYNTAQGEYEKERQNSIEDAKEDVKEVQDYIAEVEYSMNNFEVGDELKQYSITTMNEDIINFAMQFKGYGEHDRSSDIFVQGVGDNSRQVPWCSEFAKYVFLNSGHYDQLAQWYRDLEDTRSRGKNSCVWIQRAADEAGAIISLDEAQPGDLMLIDADRNGEVNHTTMIVKVENGVVYTIEGNSNNKVVTKKYTDVDSNPKKYYICKVMP